MSKNFSFVAFATPLLLMSVDLNHRVLPVSYIIYYLLLRLSIHSHFQTKKSGGYRSRTDDPLRARQVL